MKWPMHSLKSVGLIQTGTTPSTENESFWNGETPFITPADLDLPAPITSSIRSLSDAGRNAARIVSKDSVLICCIGSLGKIGLAGRSLAINQQINSISFDPNKVDYLYGYFACQKLKRELVKIAPATTIPIVSKSKFELLEIPVPPLPEQRRIAQILDKAEVLRAKRRAALAKLDTLAQSIFLEMFGDQNSILSRWETKPLGESLDFLTSGSRGWAQYYSESGDLFLRIQNIGNDELYLDDIAFVNPPDNAEAKRTRVQPGDVLLSITADLGRTAVIPDSIDKAYINQHLSILRTSTILPRYLSAYLASPMGQIQILGRNREGVKAGLNFDDIRSFQIPLPPFPLQQAFARRVEAIETVKAAHRASLAKLDALFASLQHRAFRGEL